METNIPLFKNPFRPGAGHMPPYLAGREHEVEEFKLLLKQDPIMENMILTGLRGVGKTVLLESFKPVAIQENWGWVGTDLSEAVSISEETMVTRILTDLSVFTATMTVSSQKDLPGFTTPGNGGSPVSFTMLRQLFDETPGLTQDKLKAVLEGVWSLLPASGRDGIVFAYDEAQNLGDSAGKDQYPLSLLLDVFQSIQRKGIRFLLVLTGLSTLFPKLVEARTYSERMFHIVSLNQLDEVASREAVSIPIEKADCPISFDDKSVDTIINITDGYPYFIQFVCKEVYDIWIQQTSEGEQPSVPVMELLMKLDSDFFAGRWAKVTDRQRDLLKLIARLPRGDAEFTVQEVVSLSKDGGSKPFGSSHVNQMLGSLAQVGLVYRNRHGKYSFAVPLFGEFILRQND